MIPIHLTDRRLSDPNPSGAGEYPLSAWKGRRPAIGQRAGIGNNAVYTNKAVPTTQK
jgi:hypothetical protein